MPLMTECALAEVVLRRMGAKWFIGLCLGAAILLFAMASTSGPDMAEQLQINQTRSFDIISLVGILLTVMLCATEIPYDISQRIMLILLAKPIERYQIVIGKFLGIAALTTIFITSCSLFVVLALWIQGLSPDMVSAKLFCLSFYRVISACGIAILFSTNLSEIPSIILTLIGVCLGHIIAIFNPLIIGTSLPGVVKLVMSFPLYIAPDLQDFQLPHTWINIMFTGQIPKVMVEGISTMDEYLIPSWHSVAASGIYIIAYTVAYLSFSIFAFKNRESE